MLHAHTVQVILHIYYNIKALILTVSFEQEVFYTLAEVKIEVWDL